VISNISGIQSNSFSGSFPLGTSQLTSCSSVYNSEAVLVASGLWKLKDDSDYIKTYGHLIDTSIPFFHQPTIAKPSDRSTHEKETMPCTGIQPSLRRLVLEASRTREIPSFLLPSISHRSFSTSHTQRSRIGREAITIPPEVTLRFFDLPKGSGRSRNPDTPNSALEVTGPLGT
jgi:hypothetical protein